MRPPAPRLGERGPHLRSRGGPRSAACGLRLDRGSVGDQLDAVEVDAGDLTVAEEEELRDDHPRIAGGDLDEIVVREEVAHALRVGVDEGPYR